MTFARTAALVLALATVSHSPPAHAQTVNILTVKRPAEPEWFGLYLVGKKAGWTRMEIKREKQGNTEVLVASNETFLEATLGGKPVQRRQRDEKTYEAKPGGRLLSFRTERSGDGGDRLVVGTCTPQECRAKLTTPKASPETRNLGPIGDTAEQADASRLAAALRNDIRGMQLELNVLKQEKMKAVFVRRAKIAAAGVSFDVSIVSEGKEEDRMQALTSITDEGRVAEIRFGDALVAKAEPEETAKRLDKVDLFSLSRVRLPKSLPRSVPGAIVFTLKGLPKEFQTPDLRQTFEAAKGDEITLRITARKPSATAAEKDTPRGQKETEANAEFLRSTPDIDADAPQIKLLADEIVEATPGTYAASVKIMRWVYTTLDKAYGASQDQASEVLRSKRGDCTEHTLLFTALARAAGIPARTVHGLVYAEFGDQIPALYWHAWAEVLSGGEWIAIDPTFGQPVADATHITLGRGTQVDTVGLLGTLAVVAAEPRAVH